MHRYDKTVTKTVTTILFVTKIMLFSLLLVQYDPHHTSGCSSGCIAGAVIASFFVGAAFGGACYIYVKK